METLLTRTPWVLLPFLSADVWTYGHARVHSGVRGWAVHLVVLNFDVGVAYQYYQ